jgi:glucosamine-6-phosphate deaminase
MTDAGFSISSHASRAEMDKAAARMIAEYIRDTIALRGEARVVFAAAPSQAGALKELCNFDSIDWRRVAAFHMDEYVGLSPDHPSGFGNWLRHHLFDRKPFGAVHLIGSQGEPDTNASSYAQRLAEAPIDLVCLGIGVNGHIAFNDPPVADFADPLLVRRVQLDDICRQQQVDDGCFQAFEDVPAEALTLTVPALLSGRRMIAVVPGAAKRPAVERTIHGPISTDCPASILRTHTSCTLFLEPESWPNA